MPRKSPLGCANHLFTHVDSDRTNAALGNLNDGPARAATYVKCEVSSFQVEPIIGELSHGDRMGLLFDPGDKLDELQRFLLAVDVSKGSDVWLLDFFNGHALAS